MNVREGDARRLRTLIARLDRDWEIIEAVDQRVQEALERVRREGSDTVTVGAVALYLSNLYTAIEDLLSRIASELDGWRPTGENWHRELIEGMRVEVEGVRPRIVEDALGFDLDRLRRFRDRVRHAYAEEYDWDEMQGVLVARDRCLERFPEALASLRSFSKRRSASWKVEPDTDRAVRWRERRRDPYTR